MSAPASWKKVIVSGSSAQLNQLSVDTSVNITGSLNASSSVFLKGLTNTSQATIVGIDATTGQLYYQGTGSFTANSASYAVSASYASNASTADSATSASYANNASTADSATSASYANNASAADSATSASYASTATSASYALNASTADSATSATSASYASTATSASYALNASAADSATSASYANNASAADSATSASYANNASTADSATSASYAATASYVNPLHQKVEISGSLSINTTTGTAFDVNADTFIFTGSFNTTGSVSFKGLQAASASYLLGYNPTTGIVTYEGTGSVVSVTSSFAISASHANNADNAISASYALTSSFAATVTGSSDLTSGSVTKWTGTAFANSSITDLANVTINNAGGVLIQAGGLYVTGASTFHDNVVMQGNLTVQGTASFQNSENLAIADQFILLNSGSTTFQDSGFIINTGNTANSGSAFFLETSNTTTGTNAANGRFAVGSQVLPDTTTVTASEYAVTALISGSAPGTAVPQWGGTQAGQGNMWVDSGTGDIYIYA